MSAGYVEPLSDGECRQLLAAGGVARIACLDGSEIAVLPVAYVVDDAGVLVFGASVGTVLGRLVAGGRVSVQLDDIAEDLGSGWSVLGHGWATRYDGPVQPTPWVPHREAVRIGVTIESMTGRAILRG